MMDEDATLQPPAKWPLVVAIFAALAWAAIAALALLPGIALPAPLATGLQTAITLIAPLAVIWLVALQLRERAGQRAARTALMAERANFADRQLAKGAETILTLEDRITALSSRIESVAEPLAAQHTALLDVVGQFVSTSARLTEASTSAFTATQTLEAAIPAAAAGADRLAAVLTASDTDLKRQIAETETMLAALRDRAAEAETQAKATAAETTAGMAAILESSEKAQAAVAVPLATLREGVEKAYVDTAAAMDATRDGVHTQTNAMLASVEQARVTLDHIGGEAAKLIQERLDGLLGTASRIGESVDAEAARTQALLDEISRNFTVFDAKLGNSATTGANMLDSIAERMTEARDAIHRLGEPIAATETALGAVESRLGSVGSTAGQTLDRLGIALPDALPHLDAMSERLADLHERVGALADPLNTGAESIATAKAQIDAAREALEGAAGRLGEELEAARVALADIEAMTGNASLQASSQLLDVFQRVRDVATQTAGTMRETLSGIVAEAEAALDQAGSSRAELAFASPIRAKLAELETMHERVADGAQAATERVTRRLLALTETVAGVEQRIDEADTRFDIRARNTLASRSSRLIESLQSAAIDIVGLLAFEMEDSVWENYLKGDRNIFARRLSQQIDSGGSRAVERHLQHDAEFRTHATHFVQEFEALIAHVLPDREGRSLAVTLVSSDLGRLYATLGQSMGRFEA